MGFDNYRAVGPEGSKAAPVAGVTTSTINLVKNVVAAGLVALPWAFSCMSTLVGVTIILFVCGLSAYSFIILARCCLLSKKYTFKEIGVEALGPKSAVWIQLVMMGYTFMSCVSFLVLVGDFVPNVIQHYSTLSKEESEGWVRSLVLGVSTVSVLFPLSFLKNLKNLQFSSIIGIICMLYTGGLIIGKSVKHGPREPSADIFQLDSDIFRAVPVVTVSFAAHYNGPKFFQEMGGDMKSFLKVITLESTLVWLLYTTVGVAGYWHFGSAIKSDITNNYGGGDLPALWCRLTLSFSLLTTYPFAFNSLRVNFDQIMENYFTGYRRFITKTSGVATVNAGLMGLVVLLSIAVPDIEVVLAYKGALLGSMVVFVYPGLFYLNLLAKFGRRQMKPPGAGDYSKLGKLSWSANGGPNDHPLPYPGMGTGAPHVHHEDPNNLLYNPTPTASPRSSIVRNSDRRSVANVATIPEDESAPLMHQSSHSQQSFGETGKWWRVVPLSQLWPPVLLVVFGVVTGIIGVVVTVKKQISH